MSNEFSQKIHPALLHQLYLRLTSIEQRDRPQHVNFLTHQSVSWQRPADFYDTQHSLGTTRVAVVRYGQPVQHIQQIGVTVVTSAALDLANLLNGVWDHKQPNTLRLRQLTRLLDLAGWVSGEAARLFGGQFSAPTVVEGALHPSQTAEGPPPPHILVGVMPFEIARLCAGFLIVSLEAELKSFHEYQELWAGEPFQLKTIIV